MEVPSSIPSSIKQPPVYTQAGGFLIIYIKSDNSDTIN